MQTHPPHQGTRPGRPASRPPATPAPSAPDQATPGPGARGPLAQDARGWLRQCFLAPAPPLAGMLLASALAHGCGLLAPLGHQVVFDRVFTQGVEATLLVVVAALVGLGLLEGACQGLRLRHRMAWSLAVDARLRPGLLARCLQPSPAPVPATQALTEAQRLRAGICGPLTEALLDLPLLVLLHLVLLWLAPACGLLALSTGGLLLVLHRLGVLAASAGAGCEQPQREVHALVEAILRGLHLWRSLRAVPALVQRFAAVDSAAGSRLLRDELRGALARERVQTLLRLQGALMLGLGAHEVLAGRLGGGGLVACNLIGARMGQPWLRLLAGLDAVPRVLRARRCLLAVLGTPLQPGTPWPALHGGAGPGPQQATDGQLAFEDFAPLAPPGVAVGARLSGSWPAGARIRLCTDAPGEGEAVFAGLLGDSAHAGHAWYEHGPRARTPLARVAVGITGELHLLPGSLAANLLVHAQGPEVDGEARIVEALDDAGLGPWLAGLAEGADTLPAADWPLRDPVFRLRFALARALVACPPVIVWRLDPVEARLASAHGLFEHLSRRRPGLSLILVGGDRDSGLPGFHHHAVSGGVPAGPVAPARGDGALATGVRGLA